MRICYDNYIDDSTTSITPSTERTGYVINNVTTPRLPQIFSMTTNSGNIVIDLGSAKQITAIVIGNTNITSNGSLTIEGNTSDSWGAPAYSQAITINDNTTNQILFLDETYRYWRIVFGTDATVTYMTVGHIFIGEYLQLPGILPGFTETYTDSSKREITRSLQVYGNDEFNYLGPITFNFPGVDTTGTDFATKTQIVNFFKTVRHNTPFYTTIWESSLTEQPPFYSVLDENKIDPDRGSDTAYSLKLTIREVR